MKTFSRFKTVDEIREQCIAQGVPIDTTGNDNGDDHIVVGDRQLGYALYNTFNGRFFGKANSGQEFASDDPSFEEAPWFQALLGFFYVE